MKNFEAIGSRILYIFAVFITFVLVLESHLVIPAALQVVGRMHPLILHFPIVLTFIAIGIQLFEKRFQHITELQLFPHRLWLLSGLFSGLTVIMGVLLAQEEGYEGRTLLFHKWAGAITFYLNAFFYWYYPLFKNQLSKVILALLGIGLLLTGHWGAELTHGEGFITAPIQRASKQVPLQEAIVFNDLIQPILEAKCLSCHTADKMKGGLNLTDSLSIMKGGKSGQLVNLNQPSLSLLLERIHLPIEDKKHMPPKGKPQLTADEELLLLAWIQAGLPFDKKLIELPKTDSLRVLGERQFENSTPTSPKEYKFKAASDETVQQLNMDYRTVTPLAKGSPALSVNIFNTAAFESKLLSDLDPVRSQIVELDVSKMPVSDADLKIISKFEHLEKLNLNFTNISAKGLEQLKSLKNLTSLYLAGTTVDSKEVTNLAKALPNLTTVTLWETPLTDADLKSLHATFAHIRWVGNYATDTTLLPLNAPQLKTSQWVFSNETEVVLTHPVKGVSLYYTTDGSEPTEASSKYSQPLQVKETTQFNIIGIKEGWLPSATATYQVYRNTYKPDSLQLLNKLNSVHMAEGARTFFDGQLGVIGANNPAWANHFAGVRHEDMKLLCRFDEPVAPQSITIRYMIEEETSIYPPDDILIYAGNSEKDLKLVARKNNLPAPESRAKPTLNNVTLSLPNTPHKVIKVVVSPWRKAETEHPRLLLIDEMFFN